MWHDGLRCGRVWLCCPPALSRQATALHSSLPPLSSSKLWSRNSHPQSPCTGPRLRARPRRPPRLIPRSARLGARARVLRLGGGLGRPGVSSGRTVARWQDRSERSERLKTRARWKERWRGRWSRGGGEGDRNGDGVQSQGDGAASWHTLTRSTFASAVRSESVSRDWRSSGSGASSIVVVALVVRVEVIELVPLSSKQHLKTCLHLVPRLEPRPNLFL